MLNKIVEELQNLADKEIAKTMRSFFKTGKGEYGEGDLFLGIKIPEQRKVASKYSGLNLKGISDLLDSKIHEHRLVGILILVEKFNKSSEEGKGDIFNFYIKNAKKINNWDLVDLSAPNIAGNFLLDKDKTILYNMAKSKNLWEKRISIVASFSFIKNEDFYDALEISKILLEDEHDLIHKAVGWMLREIGKRDKNVLEIFLKENYNKLPRTTLRYAIERFNKEERETYLKGKW